uniref:HMA domain-containing protein n=1 Tax=Oryza meridionalis TaxID=40149 RepID=A0A0E0DGM1_9ORYZ
MAPQKVILKVSSMSDTKVKQKAMETVADIYDSVDMFDLHVLIARCYFGSIDSIAADHKDQKMTVIGEVDTVKIAKKLKKFGKVDIISVGPAKEEKKDDKKGDKK